MPHDLINSKPISAAIKEFFGSEPAIADSWTRPTRCRKSRTSVSIPHHLGGLTREYAPALKCATCTDPPYGRSARSGNRRKGPKIGLINSMALLRAPEQITGFLETPYRKIIDGKVSDQIDYLSAITRKATT